MESTRLKVPATGLAGLKENWKTDVLSGFMVFLIALPLCLAISTASGAPPMAGILTAIVGGLFVSRLSGSFVTINGPAAGLIVVILGAVTELGKFGPNIDPVLGYDKTFGYTAMLAAAAVAGLVLFVLGLFKAGKYGDFFPASAVHGMLAAIGIIIIAKQIHLALGVKVSGSPLVLLEKIPESFLNMDPQVAAIGLGSIAIMALWQVVPIAALKRIPGPLVVVVYGTVLGLIFDFDDKKLVHIESLFGGKAFAFPNFAPAFDAHIAPVFWKSMVIIVLVQGLETLLSASAVDKLDPYKRQTNLSKDLSAVGLGSTLVSLIGGIPMIAEIVRSSANINNGAKTNWANFSHGFFMLVFVAVGSALINHIPIAALAGLLVFTGYRLSSPKHFIEVYKIGKEQLVIFVVTIIVTLAEDLIIGVGAGIVTKFAIEAYFIIRLQMQVDYDPESETHQVYLSGVLNFFNYVAFKDRMNKLPAKQNILLDMHNVTFVDHTFMEHLHYWQENYIKEGGQMEVCGYNHLKPASAHPVSMRYKTPMAEADRIITLTPRQMELQAVAGKLGLNYAPETVLPGAKIKQFPFTFSRRLKFQDNTMTGESDMGQTTICELTLIEGAVVTAREIQTTVFTFTPSWKIKAPEFMLAAETSIDRMLDVGGGQDIDFKEFPDFSNRFLLKGPDATAIRKFFTPEMIRFLEKQKNFYVECNGAGFLFYSDQRRLFPEEIERIYYASMEFVALVQKKVALV